MGYPGYWLTKVPSGLLHAYVAMLPRLTNEEALQTAERIMVGTGSSEKKAIDAITRTWAAGAGGGTGAAPRRVRLAGPDVMAGLGMKVTVVEKRP